MGLRGIGAKPVRKSADKTARKRRPTWAKPGLSPAERAIKFVESLMLTTGEHEGKRFRLRPWQKEIIRALYRTDAKGRSVVRQAVVSLPRKQGKSQLAAALALNALCGSAAEPRGQVFSAAADRKQAALIMREMVAFITADPELSARCIIRQHEKTITDVVTGSVYEALSSDARKAHGLGGNFIICDELAQWKGRELYDNLITGVGARKEPLIVTISTMSGDPNSLMSELVSYGKRVNSGEIDDPSFCAIIYAADEKDDPWAEATWFACNPALGDFRSLEEFRIAAEQAKRLPAREPSFKLLYLNMPVSDSARFLNARDWRACHAEIDPRELYEAKCWMGLDLASTTALCALAAYFPESGALLSWFWMPADGIEEKEKTDHVPYRLWVDRGFIELTPGRTIGRDFIVQRLGEIADDFKRIEKIAFDRWGMPELLRLAETKGLKLPFEPFGQGYRSMSPAVSAFEIEVLEGRLKHPSNPVLDWHVSNTVLQIDAAMGRKPAKDRSVGFIDGTVAAIQAVGVSKITAETKPSIYESRGLRILGAKAA